MDVSRGEMTQQLSQRGAAKGDLHLLVDTLYDELRRVAAGCLANHNDCTLQPTELVHKAYLQLRDQRAQWCERSHFIAIAAHLMRRILVDHVRARKAVKRGGRSKHESLQGELTIDCAGRITFAELLAVNQALERLEAFAERQAKVVEMRFFGGLTTDETAALLGVDSRTVQRDWQFARAWLHKEIRASAR